MLDENIKKTLLKAARFYDQKKVGDVGSLGFRRSTDLQRLIRCLDQLIDQGMLIPKKSLFLDMGCADGRVNVLLSYLVKISIGIELDDWTLDEYRPLKTMLEKKLEKDHLSRPPNNIFLFHGDSMDDGLHQTIRKETGVSFEEFDLFYTYLTMQEEFAELITRKAKKDAIFMVYGLEKIMPRFEGLRLLTPEKPMEGILALYQKT